MKTNFCPKVLIIGETFRYTGGGGITLINLFKDWNADNLAVVTEKIQETTRETNCNNFYRLGHLEMKFPFPFNLLNKIDDSGDVKLFSPNEASKIKNIVKRNFKSSIKFEFEMTYYRFLIFLGIFNSNYRLKISEQLLNWVKDFSPDVIYAQPFSYKDMVFALELKKASGIPIALHIMDDSVSFSNKPNLFYFHWKNKINNIFKQLVEVADIHLSISEAMSEEYFKRYKKLFQPFRNPIDIDLWTPCIKRQWSIGREVNIIYTGRLAVPNINALYTFCQAVERINNEVLTVRLHIYSIDRNAKFTAQTSNFQSIRIHEPVPFDKIPSLVTKFDIALLPIDFTKRGIDYAKYSISTKTSEYMISGVPILLFAPKQVALTKYAEKYRTMHVVDENSQEKLFHALKELISDEKLRSSLAMKAMAVAKSESNALNVRKCFREALASFKEKNQV